MMLFSVILDSSIAKRFAALRLSLPLAQHSSKENNMAQCKLLVTKMSENQQ